MKRDSALALVSRFRTALAHQSTESRVRKLTADTRVEALSIQGGPVDTPYLARTLCQMAFALRRGGWPVVGADLLKWLIARDIVDAFVLTELVVSQAASGDFAAAEETLARSRDTSIASGAMYAGLIAAYGRARRLDDAQRVFDRAKRLGVNDNCSYAALVGVYVRTGRLAQAERLVIEADAAGLADAEVYAPLLCGYLRADKVRHLVALSRHAHDAGALSPDMRAIVVRTLHQKGRSRQAERLEV